MSFKVLNSFGVGESYQYFTNVGPGTGRTYSQVHGTWVLMSTVTVPLNFFQSGDIVTIEAACSKQGSTDNWYLAMFSSAVGTLNGARLIGYCMEPIVPNNNLNNGLTYSLIQRRLHIITADGTGEGTWVIDYDYSDASIGNGQLGYQTHDHYAYSLSSYNRIGSNGTWDDTTGATSGASTTSMNWIADNNTIIIAGYTSGLTDRIRTEWIKVSGESEGGGGGF
jgi:hypothetical protein